MKLKAGEVGAGKGELGSRSWWSDRLPHDFASLGQSAVEETGKASAPEPCRVGKSWAGGHHRSQTSGGQRPLTSRVERYEEPGVHGLGPRPGWTYLTIA